MWSGDDGLASSLFNGRRTPVIELGNSGRGGGNFLRRLRSCLWRWFFSS